MTATWTWDHALTGVVPPLISPLGDGGDADAGAMAALVEHVVTGGCTGLFVLGGCGEGAWLTTAQRDAVVRAAVKAAAGRVPVLAAVMLPATGPAVEAARRARGEGADAVVVGSPYYFAVDGGGHRRHVEAVLEAAGLPGLLYNIPQCTHAVLAADTVAALARDARVLGMKDSAGDFLTFQRYLAVKRDRPDFRVLQGQESLLASSVLHGGDGAVPGVANIAPRLCVDLVRAAHAGDSARGHPAPGAGDGADASVRAGALAARAQERVRPARAGQWPPGASARARRGRPARGHRRPPRPPRLAGYGNATGAFFRQPAD